MTDIAELQQTLAKLELLYKRENLKPVFLQKIGIKPQWNVVIGTDGNCGMALNYSGAYSEDSDQEIKIDQLKSLVGRNLMEVADTVLSTDTLRGRSIGVAVVNALSQPLLTTSSLEKRGFITYEYIPEISAIIRPDDIVTMVGFSGLIWKILRDKCREVWATDMRPLNSYRPIIIGETIEYGLSEVSLYTAEENEEVLGRSDVVLITATTLVNGTFAELMRYAEKARIVSLFGPTGSQIPDVLFEHGVDINWTFCTADPIQFEVGMFNDLDIGEWPRATQLRRFIARKGVMQS